MKEGNRHNCEGEMQFRRTAWVVIILRARATDSEQLRVRHFMSIFGETL